MLNDECLELLSKLDKCIKDPDFQLIMMMKFLRTLTPYLQAVGEKNERSGNE